MPALLTTVVSVVSQLAEGALLAVAVYLTVRGGSNNHSGKNS